MGEGYVHRRNAANTRLTLSGCVRFISACPVLLFPTIGYGSLTWVFYLHDIGSKF